MYFNSVITLLIQMYYMQRITYTHIMYLNLKITLMKVMNFMCIIT